MQGCEFCGSPFQWGNQVWGVSCGSMSARQCTLQPTFP